MISCYVCHFPSFYFIEIQEKQLVGLCHACHQGFLLGADLAGDDWVAYPKDEYKEQIHDIAWDMNTRLSDMEVEYIIKEQARQEGWQYKLEDTVAQCIERFENDAVNVFADYLFDNMREG